MAGPESFFEVFVDTPIEVCEQRDPKGLYKKARSGEIQQFTGISDPYEMPRNPEIQIQTVGLSPAQSAGLVISELQARGVLD